MKNVSAMLFALTLLSCGQGDEVISPISSGEIKYKLNGVDQQTVNVHFQMDISPAAKACATQGYILTVNNYENKINNRIPTYESIFFDKITLEPGRREIAPVGCQSSTGIGVAFYSKFADDLIAGIYEIDHREGQENWIAIDAIDESGNKIEGRFSLNFIVTWENERNAIPDTVYITDGTFRASRN